MDRKEYQKKYYQERIKKDPEYNKKRDQKRRKKDSEYNKRYYYEKIKNDHEYNKIRYQEKIKRDPNYVPKQYQEKIKRDPNYIFTDKVKQFSHRQEYTIENIKFVLETINNTKNSKEKIYKYLAEKLGRTSSAIRSVYFRYKEKIC